MSNNKNSSSVIDNMVRPRSIYLSSELLPDDADASSGIYTLSEPIMAEDGHDLVFGVRSFGFNASATNISRKQGNNILEVEVTHSPPLYIPVDEGTQFLPNDESAPYKDNYTISLPDGLYTVDELFAMLSNIDNYRIPSGYKYDILSPDHIIDYSRGIKYENNIWITLNFQRVDGGFRVKPKFIGPYIKNQYKTNAYFYSAFNVNPILLNIKIVRSSTSPKLYDLLFTNKFSDSTDHPGYIPQFETNIRASNPPPYINFILGCDLFDTGKTIADKEALEFVSVDESVQIGNIFLGEQLETAISETMNHRYPTLGYDQWDYKGFVFYHLPPLNPLYVDVHSDLETYNISIDGNLKGLLIRQFALGSVNGGTSFYQYYDSPVFYRMSSSRENIDSIRISFKSEGEKWNFFNMEFFMELLVFEYPKASLSIESAQTYVQYHAQNSDGNNSVNSDEASTLSGPFHNSFPFRHVGKDTSIAFFRNPQRANTKRKEF